MGTDKKKTPVASFAERPSPFTFKSIFKCVYIALELLCIGLFIEIIITGLLLRISIKIILFTFIVLLCSVAIPKRYQKYNYLVLLIILTFSTIWVLTPDRDYSWQPSRFDEDIALLTQDVIVGQENAADIYQSFVESYDIQTLHPNITDYSYYGLTYTSVFSSDEYPDLSAMLNSQTDIIDNLLAAAEIDHCLFPVPADLSLVDMQHHRIALMKIWARFLLNSANNDLGDGRIEMALQKHFAALKMADHLYQQKTIFDNSAAILIELMAIRGINNFVMNNCNDVECLDEISARLSLDDRKFTDNWDEIYDSAKLFLKNTAGLLYETHPDGRTRRSHNIVTTLNEHFNAKMWISPYARSIVKAGAIGHWFVFPKTPSAAGKAIDAIFEDYSQLSDPEEFKKAKPKFQLNYQYFCRLYAYEAAKFYYTVQTQSRRSTNAARSTRILIELKRYYLENGTWPETLNDLNDLPELALIDPVNGLEYVYKPTDESFILYSLGRNNTDDNSWSSPYFNFDDVRYWPEQHPDLE